VSKLILMSVILMMPLVAAIAAKDPYPRRGLRRAIWAFVLFNIVYIFLLIFLYPRYAEL